MKSNEKEEPKLIRSWNELKECKSETHELDFADEDICNGWIRSKNENPSEYGIYLSTHTFYGSKHKESTRLLQQCGFNVVLANWDELDW